MGGRRTFAQSVGVRTIIMLTAVWCANRADFRLVGFNEHRLIALSAAPLGAAFYLGG
jgi:hypothetical protein